jgi:hypothetical protein
MSLSYESGDRCTRSLRLCVLTNVFIYNSAVLRELRRLREHPPIKLKIDMIDLYDDKITKK